jgi:hypothetical protein
MSRPKIKTAMIGIFVLVGLIVGGFAAYSVDRLRVINGNVSELARNWMPSLQAAKDITGSTATLRIALRDHVLQTDETEIAKAEDLVIPPFLTGLCNRIHAAIFSFCAGVMPPIPILGRSLL